MKERFEKVLSEYEKKFGDTFPTFPFKSADENEIIRIAEECISGGKDVYDSGFLELEDVQY